LEWVGNDEGVLREETEVCVGAPFGGAQLDKRHLISTEGRECERLTQCTSPFFQRTRKNMSTLGVPHQRKRDKKSEVVSYNLGPNVG
jgi:hypothetical protein